MTSLNNMEERQEAHKNSMGSAPVSKSVEADHSVSPSDSPLVNV